MFGIDGNNIYNCTAKKGYELNNGGGTASAATASKKKESFISSFLPSKLFNVKRDTRPINTIEEVRKLDNKTFMIAFNDKG